jgi:hypothetical protein
MWLFLLVLMPLLVGVMNGWMRELTHFRIDSQVFLDSSEIAEDLNFSLDS